MKVRATSELKNGRNPLNISEPFQQRNPEYRSELKFNRRKL